MAGNLDQLERLAELRRRGTLTAEEYQAEKDKLLADPGSPAGNDFIHRYRNWLIGVSGFIGLVLAVFVIKPLFVDRPAPTVAEGENASEWTISNSRDPMTDKVANTAVRTFTTPAALIEFTISCSSDGAATYRAASFDQDKEPLEMRSRFSNNQTEIPFEYRLDGEQPVKNATTDPHFNNVAILTTLPLPKVSADMAQLGRESGLTYRNDVPILRASRITFAFHLLNSDPTIAIDQEDAGLKRVLAPCIDVQQKAQAQR